MGRGIVWRAASLALVIAVVAGCQLTREVVGPQVDVAPGLACEGIPADLCGQNARDLGWGTEADIVGVRIVCAPAPCTQAAGSAEAFVLRANGQVTQVNVGWAGAVDAGAPPNDRAVLAPGVEPECIGVPPVPCEERVEDALGSPGMNGRLIVRLVVRCTTACSPVRGDGETMVTFDDGTTQESDWGYASG